MIDIKLTDKVETEENPKNTWKLCVNVMHGDADHYEDKFSFAKKGNEEEEKEFELLLKAFEAYFTIPHNIGRDWEVIKQTLTKATNNEDVAYWFSDLVGNDIRYDDCMARPTGVEVTYFDENGIEWNTDYKE